MLAGMGSPGTQSISTSSAQATAEERLAGTIEINTAEWLRLKGSLPWVELHDEPDVLWIFAGDTFPQNSAAFARFTTANASRRIKKILAYHLARKVSCNWIVGPLSQPPDLSRHLREHGFSCRIHCAGMVCGLRDLGAAPSISPDVSIEMIETPRSLAPLTTERRRRRHEGRLFLADAHRNTVWHFSAVVEGEPVGETTLLTSGGTAGLYDVEVIEKFRRRGIGSALIHAALRHARSLGYAHVVLGATRSGSPVYTRLGFRELCNLSFWKYGKTRQL